MVEAALLKRACIMFGDDYCAISAFLGTKTCLQAAVYTHATNPKPKAPMPEPVAAPGPTKNPNKNRKRKRASAKATAKKAINVRPFSKKHLRPDVPEFDESYSAGYNPCACEGECSIDCPCATSNNFCEKFCQCSLECANRFSCCNCNGRCDSKICPCFAANRECDQDLCKCHAEVPKKFFDSKTAMQGKATKFVQDLPGKCTNVAVRTRTHPLLRMGKSEVAGWGLFTTVNIKKGGIVGEYRGEIISQEEAERRGKLYDKHRSSYLFNLNQDYVVDAARRGNKLRFANHSDTPNCVTKGSCARGFPCVPPAAVICLPRVSYSQRHGLHGCERVCVYVRLGLHKSSL